MTKAYKEQIPRYVNTVKWWSMNQASRHVPLLVSDGLNPRPPSKKNKKARTSRKTIYLFILSCSSWGYYFQSNQEELESFTNSTDCKQLPNCFIHSLLSNHARGIWIFLEPDRIVIISTFRRSLTFSTTFRCLFGTKRGALSHTSTSLGRENKNGAANHLGESNTRNKASERMRNKPLWKKKKISSKARNKAYDTFIV